MTLPASIRVRLTDATGKPVPRSFAIVVLKMPAKNDHRVWVGPSNEDGRVVASRDWLLEEARKDMSFFIMDYVDPSRATGEVTVTAATSAEIEAAIAGYEQFQQYFPFRAGWLQQLVAARTAVSATFGVKAALE